VEALLLAARRGVDVRVLLPKVSNHPFTDLARGTYLRDIQAAGATIMLYTAGMMHAKVLLVDDTLPVMGSANMDIRSLLLDYEVALCTYSEPEIRATETWIRGLAEHTESGVEKVDFWCEIGEGVARLTAPLL
jgi:cardiolipin synthase